MKSKFILTAIVSFFFSQAALLNANPAEHTEEVSGGGSASQVLTICQSQIPAGKTGWCDSPRFTGTQWVATLHYLD